MFYNAFLNSDQFNCHNCWCWLS